MTRQKQIRRWIMRGILISPLLICGLFVAYAFGIARNHPFVDGNKRASFASIIVFLGLNGIDFDVPPAAATAMILSLAAGEVAEEGLTRWIRDNWPSE